ncbi:hypothetical protein MKZ38_002626 [Zalerion maritima]|uniref:Uncharacterized protein n=1 Tax=Zalerion maritima TaxID=339359 RepID=A0AAD5RYM5_9PEZI|nr:hypothetical protein MKZ38_002626 [Zalerion maritima]
MVHILIQRRLTGEKSAYAEHIHRCIQAIDVHRHRRQVVSYLDMFFFTLLEQRILTTYLYNVLPILESTSVEEAGHTGRGSLHNLFPGMSADEVRTLFALLIQTKLIPVPRDVPGCPWALRHGARMAFLAYVASGTDTENASIKRYHELNNPRRVQMNQTDWAVSLKSEVGLMTLRDSPCLHFGIFQRIGDPTTSYLESLGTPLRLSKTMAPPIPLLYICEGIGSAANLGKGSVFQAGMTGVVIQEKLHHSAKIFAAFKTARQGVLRQPRGLVLWTVLAFPGLATPSPGTMIRSPLDLQIPDTEDTSRDFLLANSSSGLGKGQPTISLLLGRLRIRPYIIETEVHCTLALPFCSIVAPSHHSGDGVGATNLANNIYIGVEMGGDLGDCLVPGLLDQACSAATYLPNTIDPAQESEEPKANATWSHTSPCFQNGEEEYCVFTSSSFAGNRGISIVTTPKHAEDMIHLPAFQHSLDFQHLNADIDLEPHFRVEMIPGKGFGLVANRSINRGDRILGNTASTMLDYEAFEAIRGEDVERPQVAMVKNLRTKHRERYMNLSTHGEEAGGYEKRVAELMSTNAF